MNPSTEKKESWEDQFDDKFDFFECAALNGLEIKAFIAATIEEARQQGRDEAIAYIQREIMKVGTYDLNYDSIYESARKGTE